MLSRSSSPLYLRAAAGVLIGLALCLIHGKQVAVEAGATSGLSAAVGGGAATLGLAAPSRSALRLGMSQRSLDMTMGQATLGKLAQSARMSAGAALSGPIQIQASNALSSLNMDQVENSDWFDMDQFAGLNDIAPPECYDNLFKRFKRWDQRFKSIKKASKGAVQETSEQLVEEAFAGVGRRLFEEECEPGQEMESDSSTGGNNNPADNWMNPNRISDFVYKTLNNVVNNLDQILNRWGDIQPFAEELIREDETAETQGEKIRSLLLRLKDRAVDYVKKQAKIKFNGMSHRQILETSAQMLTDQLGYPGDPMSYLWAMREAMQSSSLSSLSGFMGNMPFRGAIAFIAHENPMPFMKCKPKQKEPESYC